MTIHLPLSASAEPSAEVRTSLFNHPRREPEPDVADVGFPPGGSGVVGRGVEGADGTSAFVFGRWP